MSQKLLRREIHPEVRVLDAKSFTAEYVASDETLDSYREVIRAAGWRFDFFRKNAPLVDSHDYSTIKNVLGKVVDFAVRGGKLINVAQWAADPAQGNELAQMGWRMLSGGFLPAVSVGFMPVRSVSWSKPQDGNDSLVAQAKELKLNVDDLRAVYLEQQQVELSAVVIGANSNALAKAYKAGVLADADFEFIATELSAREYRARMQTSSNDEPASSATEPAEAELAQRRAEFLDDWNQRIKRL